MIFEGKEILVTGCAGFIGAALVNKLLDENANVTGIDNLNNYYSQKLKLARLEEIKKNVKYSKGKWNFHQISIDNLESLKTIYLNHHFDIVVHLAAQAGVRYSLENPSVYVNSNLVGFGNILELCKFQNINNFIFASSSSVYGNNKKIPFNEDHNVDHPISLYAATKRSNELMAHSYSHLYQIPTTALRFFTVYGPWGRPDMAPMIFAKSILNGDKIKIFNQGKMTRDFTFIDDVIEGIFKCCFKPATSLKKRTDSSSSAPFRIFNIGNGNPIALMDFILILEKKLGIKSKKDFLNMQKGDVQNTFANTLELKKWVGYSPTTSIETGLERFCEWYLKYYKEY